MLFILALCLAVAVSLGGRTFIKKHSVLCYILAAIISVSIFVGAVLGAAALLPLWVNRWVIALFSRGAFATALFVVVMYTGALPTGSRLIKALMPVRAELSILASILTLTHNASYGLTYFKRMFVEPQLLSRSQFAAGILTIILLCIMLPLTVTSFKTVRKKIKPKKWKKLHRSAYVFYALIYFHVMLLSIPGAVKDQNFYVISVLVYSIVFLSYAAMRVRKAWKKRNSSVLSTAVPYSAAFASLLLICLFTFYMPSIASANLHTENTEKAVSLQAYKSEAVSNQDTAQPSNSETTQQLKQTAGQQNAEDKTAAASATSGTAAKAAEPESGGEKNVSEHTAGASTGTIPKKNVEAGKTEKVKKTQDKPAETKPSVSAAAATVPEVKHTYRNGSFSGSGKGYAGTVTVSITINEDVIKDITVTKASEDEPYFSAAKELIGDILSKQSTDVDTVSGATFSSKGIISAVNDALKNAKQ